MRWPLCLDTKLVGQLYTELTRASDFQQLSKLQCEGTGMLKGEKKCSSAEVICQFNRLL